MSIKVMTAVWANSKQAHGSLLLLLAIADFADDNGRAFPSVQTLADKARMTERQAQRVLRQLTADGELTIERNAGPHGCHRYTVIMSPVTNCRGDIISEGVTFLTKKVPIMSPEPSEPSLEPSVVRKRKQAKASQVPDVFPVSPKLEAWAREEKLTGIDLSLETRNFLDHHRAKGSLFKDWTAAWRTWIRNAATKYAPRNGPMKTGLSPPSALTSSGLADYMRKEEEARHAGKTTTEQR